MANRNFPSSRQFSFHMAPVRIDANISIGATGAPTIVNGIGISSIERLAAGQYRIKLEDNYNSFLGLFATFGSPVTGAAVSGGSFVATTVYQIITLGTTTQAQWHTAGVPSSVTAAPGVIFVAAGVGAGSGTVKALGSSGIYSVETIGDMSTMNAPSTQGSYITFQTMGPTGAALTAPIAVDPANGSTLRLEIYMNNSSVQ